jgi:hypothetical protein
MISKVRVYRKILSLNLITCTFCFFACSVVNAMDFDYVVIDKNTGGRAAIGDIDGDGFNDIAVHTWSSDRGKQNDGKVGWYRYPDWRRYSIVDSGHIFGDGILIVDLDIDGDNDVVTAKGSDNEASVFWYENPGGSAAHNWKEHKLATVETGSEVKDIEVHDMDHDGKPDVVVRTKHKFAVYFQQSRRSWLEVKTDNAEREGMTIGDIDGDGDHDVIMNGFWLENPEHPRRGTWKRHNIDPMWYEDVTGGWQDHSVMADVKDINNDGRADIIFSHSEKTGFPVVWYESADPKGGPDAWTKHKVGVIDYCHSLRGADMDLDGDIDIVAATLIRKKSPEISVFINEGKGLRWQKMPLAEKSAYKAKTGDIDNDGDIDIVTARSWDRPPLQLWRNTVSEIGPVGQVGLEAPPPPGAEVLIDGTRRLLDEKWTYWKGPRFSSSLPIKWDLVDDPVDRGKVLVSSDPAADGGKYGAADIVTKKKYRDFRLHIEFLVPHKKGNSGVYLQNRYEIQILDGDSGKHGMAAVINEAAGPYHAYRGTGKWNAYDIQFRAARFRDGKLTEKAMVTMYFNGVKAHTNHKIRKVWGGKNSGIDGGNQGGTGITDVPGGLKLQCEGHEVLYRNAWIKELRLYKPNTNWVATIHAAD